jgi:hypothetical protein
MAVNEGQGRCIGTATLIIRPVRAVIELGALQDVISGSLNCVHYANRTGDSEDLIAVGLPEMHKGREGMRSGHEVFLLGSEASLSRLMAMEGMTTLRRRGMLMEAEIQENFAVSGDAGAAYVRDRALEKHRAGWIRRSKERALRRGKPLGKPMAKLRPGEDDSLALFFGQAVVAVREVIGKISDVPIEVTTYGFSSTLSPAMLPLDVAAIRGQLDAA